MAACTRTALVVAPGARPGFLGATGAPQLARGGPSQRTSAASAHRGAVRLGSVDYELLEETVDATVLLEAPGAVSSAQFEEHDKAMDVLDQLNSLNDSMKQAIQETESVIEMAKWDTLTLPEPVRTEFTQVYRSTRKEAERQKKEERKLRRQQRDAAMAAAAAAAAGAEAPEPAEQEQQPAVDPAERRARRALQRQERESAAAVADSEPALYQQQQQPLPLVQQQQPQQLELQQQLPQPQHRRRQQPQPALQQQQQQQQQQQPEQRQRRRRSSAAASAAVAPAGLGSSSEQQATANRGGPAGPRPVLPEPPVQQPLPVARHAAMPSASAASAAPASAAAAAPAAVVAASSPAAAASSSGFVPLALVSRGRATAPAHGAPAASASRRSQRAAGVSVRGARGSSAAPAAPVATGKLADNNIHGLDMRTDLLTADQEKELAAMVQDLLALEAGARELAATLGRPASDVEWMSAVGAAPAEGASAEDVRSALHAFQARLQAGRTAKQVMISANYKLVVAICRKYAGYGLALGDLINEGVAGLVRGVEKFEPGRGCKFSTYAHWWIRQAVTRSLSEQGRLVRLPSHLQEMVTKMNKVSRAYEAQYGREPSLDELSRELGIDAAKIRDAYDAAFTHRSLDAPVGSDADGATMGDVIEDERCLGPEESAYMESLKHDLEGVLAGLPAREAGVLRMRFGLLDGVERTLDEIGAQYNVTRERIRQIEAKAIRQLRARQLQPGSVIADYQGGGLDSKQLASRSAGAARKQS